MGDVLTIEKLMETVKKLSSIPPTPFAFAVSPRNVIRLQELERSKESELFSVIILSHKFLTDNVIIPFYSKVMIERYSKATGDRSFDKTLTEESELYQALMV